jgi:hypothetical protein
VPRLTLLFFGAAKDVPEAAKMVTARTARLPCELFRTCKPTANYDPNSQAMLRPLKRCTTNAITAMINRR